VQLAAAVSTFKLDRNGKVPVAGGYGNSAWIGLPGSSRG